jgi:hypothetical protein
LGFVSGCFVGSGAIFLPPAYARKHVAGFARIVRLLLIDFAASVVPM